jgi:hypothetical protein
MITESDAKKFQALYEKETGEEISLEDALECVESLVSMVRLIYKPIKKAESSHCTISDSSYTI